MIDNEADVLANRIARTLNAKAAQLDDMPRAAVDVSESRNAFTRRRTLTLGRRALLILAATLVLGVAGAAVAIAADSSSRGSGIDGQPTPLQQRQLKGELKDYDPAEVQYLRDQTHGTVDDQGLVGTLEFRRACRETLRAVEEAKTAGPDDRAKTVDAIMTPQVQRLIDREPADDQIDQTFADFATAIKAGNTVEVLDWLKGPRGSCTDALAWKG